MSPRLHKSGVKGVRGIRTRSNKNKNGGGKAGWRKIQHGIRALRHQHHSFQLPGKLPLRSTHGYSRRRLGVYSLDNTTVGRQLACRETALTKIITVLCRSIHNLNKHSPRPRVTHLAPEEANPFSWVWGNNRSSENAPCKEVPRVATASLTLVAMQTLLIL